MIEDKVAAIRSSFRILHVTPIRIDHSNKERPADRPGVLCDDQDQIIPPLRVIQA